MYCNVCSCRLTTAYAASWVVCAGWHSYWADTARRHHVAELCVHYCKDTWKEIVSAPACFGDLNQRAAAATQADQFTESSLSQDERGMKVHTWKYESLRMWHQIRFRFSVVHPAPRPSPLCTLVVQLDIYIFCLDIIKLMPNPIWNNNTTAAALKSDITASGLHLLLWEMTNCHRNKDTIHNIFIYF